MPRPRVYVDVKTNVPLAICCHEDEEEKAERETDDNFNNCIQLVPSRSLADALGPRVGRPFRRRPIRTTGITLFVEREFIGMHALLDGLESLSTELPSFDSPEKALLSLRLTNVTHLPLRRLRALHTFSQNKGYTVYLTVL
jgi:hypothetical protein